MFLLYLCKFNNALKWYYSCRLIGVFPHLHQWIFHSRFYFIKKA